MTIIASGIDKALILHPVVAMMVLTLFLYTKNYLDNRKATKAGDIKFSYFKIYKGDVPDYVAVSRQTLKNQFELPIFFYFLVAAILIFEKTSQLDIVLAWVFVALRYLHCYIRLSSNKIPYRAIVFQLGMLVLIAWWIIFLCKL
tara:strand:- start:67 stop:498 length:432 start_codon:yes stop_codon:yes gene_type:complete